MIRPTHIRVGDRFVYRAGGADGDVTVEILRERDADRVDLFGRPLQSWWARREDTGAEGYLDFGFGLDTLPLERVR